MGTQLPPKLMKLYNKIDQILFYQWDPIGISNFAPEDEYRSYLPQVFKIAIENTSPELLVDYLSKVRTKNMGLSSNEAHDLKITEEILSIKKDIGL